MLNFISSGNVINLVAGGAITAGSPILVGSILAVPVTDAVSGQTFAAYTEGVFSVPKASEAIVQGDKLYWDGGNSVVTKTAGTDSKPLIGFAWADAALEAATVQARLCPTLATGPSA